MDCQLDIFFLEALINGLLLAGLLALLALGLNLIFGVIDVVWICYAEIVMIGMYGIDFAYKGGMPFLLAAAIGIIITAVAGVILHYLVIRPVLETPPINQLLVTGGVLFLLACLTVLVPIAHFVLVPGFLIASIVFTIRRLTERRRIVRVHGRCPRCSTEQDFQIDKAPLQGDLELTCSNCRN